MRLISLQGLSKTSRGVAIVDLDAESRWLMDRLLDSEAWTLVGAVTGEVGGMLKLYNEAKRALRERTRQTAPAKGARTAR